MPKAATHANPANTSFWQKPLNWIQSLEDAINYDPAQAAIDRLNHQVRELKDTVRNLETRLGAQDAERS